MNIVNVGSPVMVFGGGGSGGVRDPQSKYSYPFVTLYVMNELLFIPYYFI